MTHAISARPCESRLAPFRDKNPSPASSVKYLSIWIFHLAVPTKLIEMEPNNPQKPKNPSVTQKKLSALKAKQEKRKFKGTATPGPSTGVSLDEFTSFTEHIKHSKRIFALFGAGLSVSSGLVTYRGADRHWRGCEPAIFSDVEAFTKDPVMVWWYYSHRMMRAQIAAPNPAHHALAKLAESNPNFFAVNQNVDGV